MPVNLASPGVLVREIDLTLGQVQTASDKTGAIVASFARGPVDEPVLIASENELLEVFGQPSSTDRQYEGWLTIASYLSYGGIMQVVRSDNDQLSNSYAGVSTTPIKIRSIEDYNALGYDDNIIPGVTVVARNPGSWANGVRVALLDGKADQILGGIGLGTTATAPISLGQGITQVISKVAAGAGTTQLVEGELKGIITGLSTASDELEVKILSFTPSTGPNQGIEAEVDYQQGGTWSFVEGDYTIRNEVGVVTGIASVTSPTDWFDSQTVTLQGGRVEVPWNTIANRPTTTEYARNRNCRFDEVHVVVFDDTGEVSGNAGSILEKDLGLSKGRDAEFSVGTPSYWRKFLANASAYIYGGSEPAGVTTTSFEPGTYIPETGGQWDQQVRNTQFWSCGNKQLVLDDGTNYDGGTDIEQTGALAVSVGDIAAGYDNFESNDDTNVDFLLMGSASYGEAEAQSLANKLIAIAEQRKDSLAFISPYRSSQITDSPAGGQVTIKSNQITDNIISFYSTVASSSFAIFDSGYKYMYDRFNDKFRWVPLNGDIAGCCVRTDLIAFPWFSPAGTTRGAVLNGVRLAYNPTQIQRDRLYSARINPVVFAADVGGIILFGDKTGLSASSAFDRINVRRLFIFIQDAIVAAAKDILFEFNDEVTRTSFVNIIEPFLRDIQSKRGITDYIVVCDETNNTPAVIDRNEFVADIFVKPTRSINFIGLTFVATRSGVSFEEIVGTV